MGLKLIFLIVFLMYFGVFLIYFLAPKGSRRFLGTPKGPLRFFGRKNPGFLVIIAGNGVRQCIIINYFSLPDSISSRNFRTFFFFLGFLIPGGLLEAEGRLV